MDGQFFIFIMELVGMYKIKKDLVVVLMNVGCDKFFLSDFFDVFLWEALQEGLVLEVCFNDVVCWILLQKLEAGFFEEFYVDFEVVVCFNNYLDYWVVVWEVVKQILVFFKNDNNCLLFLKLV